MYSKTRNTLTALLTATLLVATGWMFGRPVDTATDYQGALPLQAQVIAAGTQVVVSSGLHARHANRMSLAMPYYSFALSLSQRRAD